MPFKSFEDAVGSMPRHADVCAHCGATWGDHSGMSCPHEREDLPNPLGDVVFELVYTEAEGLTGEKRYTKLGSQRLYNHTSCIRPSHCNTLLAPFELGKKQYRTDYFVLKFVRIMPKDVPEGVACGILPVAMPAPVVMPEPVPMPAPATNPKAAFGDKKVPVFLVPLTFIYGVAVALVEGASKYGKWNWRRTPVEASTYVHATGRHLLKWYHGEDKDPVTQIHHLYNAAASLCILIDAEVAKTLIDDRPPKVDTTEQAKYLEDTMAHLKELFKDHKPTHYTESN
jgi:hypothetical protein